MSHEKVYFAVKIWKSGTVTEAAERFVTAPLPSAARTNVQPRLPRGVGFQGPGDIARGSRAVASELKPWHFLSLS